MPTQTKVKCANPFCENPVETECAGEELCAFCEAEERTIIHNYKDESGPDEAPVTTVRKVGVNPVYEMSDEEWEQEQRDREEAYRAYDEATA